MRSKYLTDIGVSNWIDSDNETLATYERYDKLAEYAGHQYVYGVDPRECYDVEESLYEYVYCLLMQYKLDAKGIIDLHYHAIEYNGINWYQDEIIDRCLNAIKQWLKFKERVYPFYLGEALDNEVKDSFKLLLEILWCMWW